MKENTTKKYALNYIYLSRKHAGGKDQVALNLLQGWYETGVTKDCVVFCYEYSVDIIRSIAPDVEIEVIDSHRKKKESELLRLLRIVRDNTFVIPELLEKYKATVIFHASCTNGLRKFKVSSVVIPHDIKAVSHRILGEVKISLYKYILYRIMYSIDFKHADRIVAISKSDLREMSRYYPQYREKLVHIYNPIKVSLEEQKDNSELEKHGNNIVAINLQFHHKNIITLIKAFEKIKDKIDSDLVLIGAVPKRVHYLIDYVEGNQLSDRVKFTGFVNAREKRAHLMDCALYVNPSLFEGFGMTAVEAMILGVPTLLAKVSTNEEVTMGMCNYYEPADDVDALAAAILKCLNRTYEEQDLLTKSKKMQEAYDYRVIAGQYMNLFHQVGDNA